MLDFDFPTFSIFMMIYSFIGWFYESTIYSLAEQNKFMNRGCFIGPYCPIYGVVNILSVVLLLPIQNPWIVILASGLLCALIELITSVVLEDIFHATYWDYSNYPLNFEGRISVPSTLFFGLALFFGSKILHPFCLNTIKMLSPTARLVLCIIFCVMFFSDLIFTTIAMINLNKKCKEIYDHIDEVLEGRVDALNEKKEYLERFTIVKKSKQVVVIIKGIPHEFDERTKNLMIRKKFHSTKYGDIIERIIGQSPNQTEEAKETLQDAQIETEQVVKIEKA